MKHAMMIVSMSFMLAGHSTAVAQVPPPVPGPPPLALGPPPIFAPAPPPPNDAQRFDPRHVEWCAHRYRSYRAYDNSYQPYEGPRRSCYSPFS
jgi:hypothetical protein